ncbi:MAG: sulfatase-like hydrolase/transferase [Polyangiaceae bacterium]|nr:sulfatase-like hydrolase/transferase [Polyangiaceae bacterium]
MAKRVLFITSDQQRADTLGAYGSPLGATPHLDALAARGAVFTRAHCQHPYCQPSRWTILTGQHPRTHGVWTNGVDPEPQQLEDALSTRLSARGVATSFVGKAHLASVGVLRPGASPHMEALGNALRMPDDWTGPYMGFERVQLLQMGHYPAGYGPAPLGLHYGRFLAEGSRRRAWSRFLQAGPRRSLSGGMIAPQTWHSALPEELHPTTWITDRAIEEVERLGDSSWLLWVSYADPHHPFAPPAPWCHRYRPDDMILPERRLEELDDKPPLQRRFARGYLPVDVGLNTASTATSDRALATMMAAYYGMIAQIDHGVGRLLEALAARGLADDTLIVFTVDHGELMGDHHLLFKGPFHYEGLLRVPLIVAGDGVPAGARSAEPVGTIDLAPTFERALGAPRGPRVEGSDLLPVARGEVARDGVVTENDHRVVFREHVLTLTTRHHKLNMHVGRPYGELYDLDDDPGERVNLWRHRPALRAELARRLEELLPPAPARARPPATWLPA